MKGQRRVSLALALAHHAVALASLIKRAVRAYRDSRTGLGRSAIAAGCRLTEQTIVPALACQSLLRRFPENPLFMVKMMHLCRHKAKILVFTLGWIVSMAGVACAPPAVAADRAYFIAADEVNWDYAPAGRDRMMGMPFDEAARGFVKRGDTRIGKVYVKARYREYMDETFTVVKPRPPRWQHLGLLGPVIRAEVGDTIRVVFRNNTGFPASVHPHGVFYSKAAEGSPYADGTTGKDKHDDAVPPGGQHTYLWSVPELDLLALSFPCDTRRS